LTFCAIIVALDSGIKLIYFWSRAIGEIILKIISVIAMKAKLLEILYLIKAQFFCLKHLEEIKKGDLDFFNKTLR